MRYECFGQSKRERNPFKSVFFERSEKRKNPFKSVFLSEAKKEKTRSNPFFSARSDENRKIRSNPFFQSEAKKKEKSVANPSNPFHPRSDFQATPKLHPNVILKNTSNMTTLLKITALSLYLCTWITPTHAQTRVFLDIPRVSYFNPNTTNLGERMGVDFGIDLNFASHFMLARVGTGSIVTFGTQGKAIDKSLISSLYGKMETGIGLYRTNGKRCSLGHSSAFTALVLSGARFSHLTQYDSPEKRIQGTNYGLNGFDFYFGVELGYFFIRDMYKNYDFFLRGDYLVSKDVFTANAGVKLFLNLKANRNYKL